MKFYEMTFQISHIEEDCYSLPTYIYISSLASYQPHFSNLCMKTTSHFVKLDLNI